MKIFFVGIHDKPGKRPLCGSTFTGKMIDDIYAKVVHPFEIVKTNLFDTTSMPPDDWKMKMADEWLERTGCQWTDVVVCLGKEVDTWLPNFGCINVVNIPHPGSQVYKKGRDKYIQSCADKINDVFNCWICAVDSDSFNYMPKKVNKIAAMEAIPDEIDAYYETEKECQDRCDKLNSL